MSKTMARDSIEHDPSVNMQRSTFTPYDPSPEAVKAHRERLIYYIGIESVRCFDETRNAQ